MRRIKGSRWSIVVIWIVTVGLALMQTTPAFAMALQQAHQDAQMEQYKLHAGVAAGYQQTMPLDMLAKAQARHAIDPYVHTARFAKPTAAPIADVQVLTSPEMHKLRGSGQYRNVYFCGDQPAHRTFHDVDVCTGNLFKTFTDMKVNNARGAGLVLQRTYNSNDPRVGPFGVGWTHAYDIRNTEATSDPSTSGSNNPTGPYTPAPQNMVNSYNFFGRADAYHRDADGLYTPPSYKFDQLSSTYNNMLASGPDTDTDQGQDGTIKYYATNGNERDCQYIKDRHCNTTTLTYNTAITMADGRHPLQTVTDPSGRSIQFFWANIGTSGQPAWRITGVEGPLVNGQPVQGVTYCVQYQYYMPSDLTGGAPSSDQYAQADYLYNLKSVTLDPTTFTTPQGATYGNPNPLNRTTTYTYTYVEDSTGVTENALLASITTSTNFGNEVTSYAYTILFNASLTDGVALTNQPTPTGTAWCWQITEPAGINPGGPNIASNQRTITWTVLANGPGVWIGDGGIVMALGLNSNLTFSGIYNGKSNNDNQSLGYNYALYSSWYEDPLNPTCATNKTCEAFQQNDPGADGQLDPNRDDQTSEVFTFGSFGNQLTHCYTYGTGVNTTDGPVETTTYDNASQYFEKASDTDMNGHTTQYGIGTSMDPNIGNRGEMLWVRDARSAITNRIMAYKYNQYGQKIAEINENGVETTYTYGDTFGNLTQVVQDPNPPGQTGHLDLVTAMTYDAAGHVLTSTDPKGLTTTTTYNVIGQPTIVETPAISAGPAGETISYAYDLNGRTLSVTNNRGATNFSYESGSDRVSTVTDPVTGKITYTYVLTGEKSTMQLPDQGTSTYYYLDPLNQSYLLPSDDPDKACLAPAYVIDDQGRRSDFYFDGRGVLYTQMYNETFQADTDNTQPNVTPVQYCQTHYVLDRMPDGYSTHDWTQQMSTVYINTLAPQGSPQTSLISQNVYTYDKVGQRLTNEITDNSGTVRTEIYQYDELNRLTNVNYGDGETQTYQFDPMGNRLSLVDNVTGNHSYTPDSANRLTAVDGLTYSNDLDGNTLSGGGRTNLWDSQNRLVACQYNGDSSMFTYGPDGLRRSQTVTSGGTSTTTNYVLDGDNVVQEMQNGAVTATYFTGGRGPMYRRADTTGSISWYVYDALGCIVDEINPSGEVTAHTGYDVYGAVRGLAGTPTTSHGFVGALGHMSEPNTGLIYMRARYYDPSVGRFNSEDPAKDGGNWYTYCGCNPVSMVDGSGKTPTLAQKAADWSAWYQGMAWVMIGVLCAALAWITRAVPGCAPLAIVAMTAAGVSAFWDFVKALDGYDGDAIVFTVGLGGFVGGSAGAALTAEIATILAGAGAAARLSINAGYTLGCAVATAGIADLAALALCN